MVTPRPANYTSARNEPPRVLILQYIKLSLKYISVNETEKCGLFCPLAARLIYLSNFYPREVVGRDSETQPQVGKKWKLSL